MLYLLYILIFMLGASVASFVSVYLERGAQDKFFSTRNRSICLNCLRKLNIFELIPVFSYVWLRGKCRTCKTQIPKILFIGEIFLGVWFLASYIYFLGDGSGVIFFGLSSLFGTVLYLLSLQDLENLEASDIFLKMFVLLGLLSACLHLYFFQSYFENIYWAVLNIIIVPILIISPFWFIYLLNKKWIGEADPLAFTAIALFYGSQFAISLFLYSVWLGTLLGVLYLVFINKKLQRNIPLPFLPILFLSTLGILIFNYHIIRIQDILILNEIFFQQ